MPTTSAPAEPALLGGRFRIDHTLTEHGRFRVSEGYDTSAESAVVLKMTCGEEDASLDINRKRLEREAIVLSLVRHEHIVRLVDAGAYAGGYFLALERLEAPTLEEALERAGTMDVCLAVNITSCVLKGLSALHRANIIHRDIKPANIMIGGGVHIIDFDLATFRAHDGRRAKRITESGFTVGTPAYMAPEQCRGDEDQDARGDLYACGIVLYEMLVGRGPYPRVRNPRGILHQQIHAAPEPISCRVPRGKIPEALQRVVHRSLAKRREDRFQTADEMRNALLSAKNEC